ncbi:hypothetical protein N0V88_007571 [Collariella sp. IMI 366227]|nr:hypothetical protein N0V88_007571 [Collariella sp. IMI 366227]
MKYFAIFSAFLASTALTTAVPDPSTGYHLNLTLVTDNDTSYWLLTDANMPPGLPVPSPPATITKRAPIAGLDQAQTSGQLAARDSPVCSGDHQANTGDCYNLISALSNDLNELPGEPRNIRYNNCFASWSSPAYGVRAYLYNAAVDTYNSCNSNGKVSGLKRNVQLGNFWVTHQPHSPWSHHFFNLLNNSAAFSTMTDANTTRFNAEAVSWDSNPDVQLATTLAHKAYLSHLPAPDILSTYNIMDLGCGTGLLSLALAPSVRSVTAVDSADGMIAALEHKLSVAEDTEGRFGNVKAVCALLEDPDDERIATDPVTGMGGKGRRFDLVVSHLVLHHIPDLERLFKTIHGCVAQGGRVMVTDFEDFGPEARKFHPESKMDGVERHGIKRGY